MSIQIIYFVHGTTYDNAIGKCSGWKQVELTDIGKERVIKLGNIRIPKSQKQLKFWDFGKHLKNKKTLKFYFIKNILNN